MLVIYRVMPEDGEVEFEVLKEKSLECIKAYDSSVQVRQSDEADVGFGLKALRVTVQIDETKGSEELENTLRELDEVGDVIVESMDRL